MPDSAYFPRQAVASRLLDLDMIEQSGSVSSIAREYTPAPVFVLNCAPDAADSETGVDIVVRMLGRNGRVFRQQDYREHGITIECIMVPGLDYISGHEGRRDYLHLHGRHADLSLALASVAFIIRSDTLRAFQLQVIAAELPAYSAGRDWYSEPLADISQEFSRGPALAQARVKVSVLGV